ncbi:hypothetical protein JTE90_015093 [Oedothorax gibbosus]|uniref:RING-type E3 ubiquitin transferase n=1 Tax=Oedothorax gibbosus TaxID=931172 RepID=A0AAV6VT72_9ARAC|nr:hypothetical protein JTE90_015093 [Oedothorax gibbosus]
MNKPQSAGTSEILRSSQKDEEYLHYLRSLVADITQRCLGIPIWIKWREFSNTFSDALFYSLTTLSGLQTLGEEYSNIIQVNRTLKSVPPRWVRMTDVSFRTFGCYFLLKLQTWLEKEIAELSSATSEEDDPLLVNIKEYLPAVFKALGVMQRLHLIVFYLYGNYYSISKRLTGIKYVVIRRWLAKPDQQLSYKLLGWIAATQLCLSLAVTIYSKSTKSSLDSSTQLHSETSEELVTSKNQCSLCFEKRNSSTATPCGHLFCWSCITSWMQNKEECPLCRESFPPSKLILLQNYY